MTRNKNKGLLHREKGMGTQIAVWKREIEYHRMRIRQLERAIAGYMQKGVAG